MYAIPGTPARMVPHAATPPGWMTPFLAGLVRRRADEGRVRAKLAPFTLLTDFAYHCPPRGVVIPRAFRAAAIWCNDVAPARCISRIRGSTLAA